MRGGMMVRGGVALTIAALAMGCGGDKTAPAPKATKSEKAKPGAHKAAGAKKKPGADEAEPAAVVVPKVADLPVLDLAGLKARVVERNKPLTLVAVWATWCVPCIKEMPELAEFFTHHSGEGLDVLGLCTDDKAEMGPKIQGVLDKVKVPFSMALLKPETEETFFEELGVEWDGGLPATVVFDATGKKVLYLREALTPEILKAKIAPLLTASK